MKPKTVINRKLVVAVSLGMTAFWLALTFAAWWFVLKGAPK